MNIVPRKYKMKKFEGLGGDLITSIDVLNTLHGGVAEPQLKLKQFTDYRQIELKVPGVSREKIKAEINNNQLTVYFTLSIQSRDRMIPVPRVVYHKPIPYFIDRKKISAVFEDETLIVTLPYNELANGYHRDITKVS